MKKLSLNHLLLMLSILVPLFASGQITFEDTTTPNPCGLFGVGTNGTYAECNNGVYQYSIDQDECDHCSIGWWQWTLSLMGEEVVINPTTSSGEFPITITSETGVSAEIVHASRTNIGIRWICNEGCTASIALAELTHCGYDSFLYNPIIRINTNCCGDPGFQYCALLNCGTFCIFRKGEKPESVTTENSTFVCFNEPITNIIEGTCDIDLTKQDQDRTTPIQAPVIYPNPANDFINIQLPQLEEEAFITITDLTGKVVAMEPASSGKTLVGINLNLAPGIYLVSTQIGDRLFSSKFIKQ